MGNCCCPDESPSSQPLRRETSTNGNTLGGVGRMTSGPDTSEDEVRKRMLAAAEARRAKNEPMKPATYHDTRNNARRPPAAANNNNNTSDDGTNNLSPSTSQPILPRQESAGGGGAGRTTGGGSTPPGTGGGMAEGRQQSLEGHDPETNPMLRAAMARRAAAQGNNPAQPLTAEEQEKARLLAEVRAELRRQQKEEPFGIAASSADRLRSYLKHLKSGGK